MTLKLTNSVRGAVACALLFAAGCASNHPPPNPTPTAATTGNGDVIPRIIEQISEVNLRLNLFFIAKDPLPFRKANYTLPGHKRSTLEETDAWITKRLRGCGYTVTDDVCEVQAYACDLTKPRHHTYAKPAHDAPFYTVRNLYAKKTGRRLPREIILLVAHKDSQSWID